MDTAAVLDLMREVADQVITPRFRALESGDVMEKNPGDLVTVADQEAEDLLTAALNRAYPDALVVGEEATAGRPDLPGVLAGADHAFTVDPVDGTKNFVRGSADHAVMIAELRSGETVRAWILHPAHDVAYVAEKGAGVYRDGERLPAVLPVDDVVVCTSSPAQEGRHGSIELGPTAWSCGIDYPKLVEGRVQGLLYTRAMPWDHCPGALMVAETGGVVRFLDGAPYDVAEVPDAASARRGVLAAASPEVWDSVAPQVADLF